MRAFSVRAVVFDAVGTLITPDPPAGVVYHRVGERHGSERSVAEVTRAFGRAFRLATRGGPGEPHRTDETKERAFWHEVVRAVWDDLPRAAAEASFQELFDHFSRPAAWRAYADVAPALAALRERGLTLAVASNFDARLHRVFAGLPELQGIGRRFVSSEIGWRKPDRRFFAAVCEGLGLEPRHVLYVGDEPESDVAAAIDAGLNAILIERDGASGPGLVTELSQLPDLVGPTPRGGGT